MKKICFVCHGNICRSPMAEFVFKSMIEKKNLSNYKVISRATSFDAINHDIHSGTKSILKKYNINFDKHMATRLEKSDYDKFDYFIGMDDANVLNMKKIFENDQDKKIFKLLDITKEKRDIADPWYTGDFEQTYKDILIGCEELIKMVEDK